jgi:aldehyde dehydrogenase (NAD+)
MRRVRPHTPAEWARLLSQLARTLEGRAKEFAPLETLDTGKPLSFARGELTGCVRYLDYYAGAADKIEGSSIPTPPPPAEQTRTLLTEAHALNVQRHQPHNQ